MFSDIQFFIWKIKKSLCTKNTIKFCPIKNYIQQRWFGKVNVKSKFIVKSTNFPIKAKEGYP